MIVKALRCVALDDLELLLQLCETDVLRDGLTLEKLEATSKRPRSFASIVDTLQYPKVCVYDARGDSSEFCVCCLNSASPYFYC